MSYPKVVALDTDWTIWKELLDHKTWGRGKNAFSPVEDNIERLATDNRLLRDRTNHAKSIRIFGDISRVVNDILRNNGQLAIVSRNPSKPMQVSCDRALYYFNAINPNDNNEWSISDLAQYNEVVDESKVNHFRRIQGWSSSDYSDMVLFDDEAFNNVVRIELGITFQFVRDGKGLTWETYQRGLQAWRRAKSMMVASPASQARRVHIGYSGLSTRWINLVENGEGIVDRTTPYRWGYALYVADNIGIAKAYRDWDRKDWHNESYVCEVWVKDYDLWTAMNKIWVPEAGTVPMTNNQGLSEESAGQSQENRDRFIARRWGVQTPYVLFSRHHWFHILPPHAKPRSNEMVVYTQIQRSLFELVRLDDATVAKVDSRYGPYSFHKQTNAWNITVPNETVKDLRSGEANLFQE